MAKHDLILKCKSQLYIFFKQEKSTAHFSPSLPPPPTPHPIWSCPKIDFDINWLFNKLLNLCKT